MTSFWQFSDDQLLAMAEDDLRAMTEDDMRELVDEISARQDKLLREIELNDFEYTEAEIFSEATR